MDSGTHPLSPSIYTVDCRRFPPISGILRVDRIVCEWCANGVPMVCHSLDINAGPGESFGRRPLLEETSGWRTGALGARRLVVAVAAGSRRGGQQERRHRFGRLGDREAIYR